VKDRAATDVPNLTTDNNGSSDVGVGRHSFGLSRLQRLVTSQMVLHVTTLGNSFTHMIHTSAPVSIAVFASGILVDFRLQGCAWLHVGSPTHINLNLTY